MGKTTPNRREPLTIEMVSAAAAHARTSTATHLEKALADWFILGILIGPRLSEWAQDSSTFPKNGFKRNVDGSVSAFIASDFQFRGNTNKRLGSIFNITFDEVASVIITWRYQKNGDNGQTVTVTKNLSQPDFCPVAAIWRIQQRAASCKVASTHPVAVYPDDQGKAQYITSSHIATALKTIAQNIYNITDKKDLGRFTSHSLRVGACVALHMSRASIMDIKHRLRWRSDSFQTYLCDIFQLGTRHNEFINHLIDHFQH